MQMTAKSAFRHSCYWFLFEHVWWLLSRLYPIAALNPTVPPSTRPVHELEPGKGFYRRLNLEIFPGYKLTERVKARVHVGWPARP